MTTRLLYDVNGVVTFSHSGTLTVNSDSSAVIHHIYGGTAANGRIDIDGTSNATRSSSAVCLLPNGGKGVIIGSTTSTWLNSNSTGLDIWSGGRTLILGGDNNASTRTDATQKNVRIVGVHYTNAEEPVQILLGAMSTSASIITFGGGTSASNCATNINFTTAADTTTVTGTTRMTIDSSGNVGIGGTSPTARAHVFGTADTIQLNVVKNSTQTSDLARFGDSTTNYAAFEADGTLKFLGNATYWIDVAPYSTDTGANASSPAKAQYGTTSHYLYKFGDNHGADEELTIAFQMPHAWKVASDAHFHIHVIPSANGSAGNEDVVFRASYQWINVNSAFSTTTNTDLDTTFRVGATDANKHLIWEPTAISGTGKTLSSAVLLTLKRLSKTSGSDNYTGDVWLLFTDIHVECDTIGSRDEGTK